MVSNGILPTRNTTTRALVLGAELTLDWPGVFNEAIGDVSQRANLFVGTRAQRLALTGQNLWRGMHAIDTDYVDRGLLRYSGTSWGYAGARKRQWSASFRSMPGTTPIDVGDGPASDNYYVNIIDSTIPAALALAGEYEVTVSGRWRCTDGATIGYVHAYFNGENVTGDMQFNLTEEAQSFTTVVPAVLTADATSAARFQLAVRTDNAQVLVYNIGCVMTVKYLGPLT